MKLNILIVDDDDAHRAMLSAVLTEDGYEILTWFPKEINV